MGVAKTYSAELIGLKSERITIEVDISNGLNSFSVVGLGDRAVDESKDRVAAAIKNSGFTSPKQKNQKVVISLAPADLRKEGASFDLAMAVAYLAAAEEILMEPETTLFLGELSLEGRVRKVSGLLPILCQASKAGFNKAFVPCDNSVEASLARDISIYPVTTLLEVLNHLSGKKRITPLTPGISLPNTLGSDEMDLSMIRGNDAAKRGLEIAAAGAHNVLMSGPPGTGKTILAKCFPTILPPLSYDESVEVTGIHSAAGILDSGLMVRPPFRSPHHTASYPSVVGGGAFPRPGEITLAHRGVLFMDEFPEFDRSVIEALRQPLEERSITISRAKGIVTFPAQCILIASMNPCPCGKGKDRGCTCSLRAFEGYKKRISGPVVDRIDIWLDVGRVEYERLGATVSTAEMSSTVRKRISEARRIQKMRFEAIGSDKRFNSEMGPRDIDKIANMEEQARKFLIMTASHLQLSGRAFHRLIKVGRTIADLDGENSIKEQHMMEAVQYRQKSF